MVPNEHLEREKGFIPVMIMPFDESGKIDYKSLSSIIEFYSESGAVGLFANCLSSEMFDLSPDERLDTTRFIVDAVNGFIPVVATGNFGISIQEQSDFVKRMYETGVDAVILSTSLLAKREEPHNEFVSNTADLIERTNGIPLGFYECPFPYKRVVRPYELGLFLESNRIVYYKDTSLDLDQVRSKIEVSRGFDFKLYDAYLGHAVKSLESGTDGLSCIQGNFFPEVIVWLCENYFNKNLQSDVDYVQDFLIKKMDIMHTAYPSVAKYFLRKRGIEITTFSRSNPALDEQTARGIDKLFEEYKTLKEELGI